MLTHNEIVKLTPPERLELIGNLWDSFLDAELIVSLPQQRELERRLASFSKDKTTAITWENLKMELADRVI